MPLSEALLLSSRSFHFKVAFDAKSVGALTSHGVVSGSNAENFLNGLLANTGFTSVYKHGSFLVFKQESDSLKPPMQEVHLQGSVVDAETGEQLPFASVSVPEQNIQCVASTNGTFSIKNAVANPMRIVVSYIGYSTTDTLVAWIGSSNLRIRLKQQAIKIKAVDVVSNKLEIIDYRNDVDFATTVNANRLVDMPMLAETDIFRTLQLLPGIRYAENTSELSIRGGTSDQNLVLFDGQTLYNLSHYYGVFSSINPNMVKDIQVYKGGFDSRYGERISGIVDITGKSGNRLKPGFVADVNLLSVNLAVEVPLSEKLTLVAAARRSYSDIYSTSFSRNLFSRQSKAYKAKPEDSLVVSEPTFRFYDLNTKLNYRISQDQNLSISIYGGRDFFSNAYSFKSHDLMVTNTDSNMWYNYGASINWQRQWNPSFFTSVLAGASGYVNTSGNVTNITRLTSGGDNQEFLPDSQNVFLTHNRNELKDLSFSVRNTFSINSFNQLNFGFLFRNTNILYYKDADSIYIYDNNNHSSSMASVYAQDRISPGNDFLVKPGIRLTWFGGTGKVYLEPRLALRYNVSENFSLRLATGRYYQFISQVQSQQETGYTRSFWVMANDSVNPVLKADHFVAGASWQKRKFMVDVEGYFKKYTGLQEYIFLSQFLRNRDFGEYFPKGYQPPREEAAQAPPSYFISGSGKSMGVDVLFTYSTKRYTSWLSYTLSKSVQQFTAINNGEEIPSLLDQTHQLSVTNMFTPGNWSLGAVFLYQTGQPYIIFSDVKMDGPITRRYSRMTNYFRCDLSANYNFMIKPLRCKAGMSIINLFDNRNYYDVNSRTFDFENTSFTETNLIPSQRLSLNLFLRISL
jgi:hypothetical protein